MLVRSKDESNKERQKKEEEEEEDSDGSDQRPASPRIQGTSWA